MAGKLEQLKNNLGAALGSRIVSLTEAVGEITVVVNAADYLAAARTLHDDPGLAFAQLMDLCGVDYSAYGESGSWKGARFAAVSQLLSIEHNWRVRLRVFAPDDGFPVVESLTGIWSNANWYAKRSTCSASCSPATRTCAAFSPTTALSAIRSARISRYRAMSRCATTRSKCA
jgi:NADH-quinone oxidoreductase subunit C